MTHQGPTVQGCNFGEGSLGVSRPFFTKIKLKSSGYQFRS